MTAAFVLLDVICIFNNPKIKKDNNNNNLQAVERKQTAKITYIEISHIYPHIGIFHPKIRESFAITICWLRELRHMT